LHDTDSTLATKLARYSMRTGRYRYRHTTACAPNAAGRIGRSDAIPSSAPTPVGNEPTAAG
jgi:hypothetical protein